MIEILEWIFSSFWRFAGVFCLIWLIGHVFVYWPIYLWVHREDNKRRVELAEIQANSNNS